MSSISDVIIAQGNAAANARSARGNIYADLIRNLSSLPGQVIQQQRSAQLQDMEQQRLKSQIASAASQQQLDALKVSDAQRQTRDRDALDAIWGDRSVYNEDGTVNRHGLQTKLQASPVPHLFPQVQEAANSIDEGVAKNRERQRKELEDNLETLGRDSLSLAKTNYDPGYFQLLVSGRAMADIIPKDEAKALVKIETPEEVQAVAERWKARSSLGKPKIEKLGPGDVALDLNTGKPLYSAPEKPSAPSPAGFAAIANDTTKTPEERAAARKSLADLQANPGEQETARHNAAMERIDTLRVGKQAAAEAETARHNRSMEANTKLTKVTEKDPITGRDVVKYLPQSELAGKTFSAPTSATLSNRLASAQSVTQVGNDIISKLSDPAYMKTVGPAMGRVSKLQDLIGNPPPEFAELAGQIESYALANMGVHGMRSAQGAKAISDLLEKKHTPESLIATIKGLNSFASDLLKNEGRQVPGATPPPPAGAIKVGGFTLTPK